MASPFLFDRITIIGLGLIGGSIALAARKHKLAESIVGCDDNAMSLTYARSSDIIDVAMGDLATAVRDSALVVIATPPSAMEAVAEKIGAHLKKGAILMDTASVKLPIMQAVAGHLPSHVNFIPAHPVAGSEKSGVRAGRADLFHGRYVIVTPNEPLQDKMLQTVTSFWSRMGARVEGIPPDLHDRLYAYISHLPHLLAFAAAKIIAQPPSDPALTRFLRLSGSNTAMWTEIFQMNRAYLLPALDRYLDALWHITGELSEAPENEASAEDASLVRTRLFARVAASCLITTVMEAEKQAGFSYARYAGTGFNDFVTPATDAPEEDIERISQHYLPMIDVLQEYTGELKKLRELISGKDPAALEEALK